MWRLTCQAAFNLNLRHDLMHFSRCPLQNMTRLHMHYVRRQLQLRS